jgi:hypothetical protein
MSAIPNTEIGVIQAPEPGPRIMRSELLDFKWTAIGPFLSNKPRGVPRVAANYLAFIKLAAVSDLVTRL